ncbi:hypothetical protein CC1G_06083 [Coprinopsis cinerea okayama7|uniref:Uncharacterized protein n=1 Tax=Coprinopsis cinerea (strain Okayama-7 / 130 / ATCC MYA-4618 / FGSC 9003) TaxID=240176 RepID=A8PA34_COPC7|nr:hypothetical protein CC1G_06083 [Coprinopsis cinerea okayama7\|eukprot:XP_001839893.2 hypothetical protein CC1G_06083 [Coprinopsis cinerea okayama7\
MTASHFGGLHPKSRFSALTVSAAIKGVREQPRKISALVRFSLFYYYSFLNNSAFVGRSNVYAPQSLAITMVSPKFSYLLCLLLLSSVTQTLSAPVPILFDDETAGTSIFLRGPPGGEGPQVAGRSTNSHDSTLGPVKLTGPTTPVSSDESASSRGTGSTDSKEGPLAIVSPTLHGGPGTPDTDGNKSDKSSVSSGQTANELTKEERKERENKFKLAEAPPGKGKPAPKEGTLDPNRNKELPPPPVPPKDDDKTVKDKPSKSLLQGFTGAFSRGKKDDKGKKDPGAGGASAASGSGKGKNRKRSLNFGEGGSPSYYY